MAIEITAPILRTVLALQGDVYDTHAIFRRGESVTSLLLGGFELSVDAILNAS